MILQCFFYILNKKHKLNINGGIIKIGIDEIREKYLADKVKEILE